MPAATSTGTASDALIAHQQTLLDAIQKDTSGTITKSFSDMIASFMPSAAIFRSAYTKELSARQDALEEQGGAREDARVSLYWLQTSGFLRTLLDAMQAELDKTAKEVAPAIQNGYQQAKVAGQVGAVAMGAQAAGVQPSKLTSMQLLQQAVALDDASNPPEGVDETIDAMPSDTTQQARQSIMAGVVNGMGSQVVMMGVQTVLQGALGSMMGLGANAAAQGMQQSMISIMQGVTMANGWIWTAENGACIACLEMDGSFHGWDEPFDSHPNCGCSPVPYSGPASGLDDIPTGEDWFMAQDDAVQAEILGPSKYLAWKNGDFQLFDLVSHDGGMLHERSLKDLGLDFRDYLQQMPTKRELLELPDISIMGPHAGAGELTAEEQALWDEAQALVARAAAEGPTTSLAAAERYLSGLQTEVEDAFVFTPEGEFVFTKRGIEAHAEFTDKEVAQMRGNILTHNHLPGENNIPSFSVGDVRALRDANLAEIRAVSGDVVYSLKPPIDGWGSLTSDDLAAKLHDAELAAAKDLHPDVAAGRMSLADARKEVRDRALQQLADDTGMRYSQTTIEEAQALVAQAAKMPELPELPNVEEVSPAVKALQDQRATLQAQRDAIQAKQDILSTRWAKIVRETDFSEEDEATVAEKKLAAIEKQQAGNIKQMDALASQIARLDTKIDLAVNAPQNLAELQATVQDLQAQRLAAINERAMVESGKDDLGGQQYVIEHDELIPAQRQTDYAVTQAEWKAQSDLIERQLQEQAKTDPEVKQFLKDRAKYQEKDAAHRAAYNELQAAKAHADEVGAKVVYEQGPAPSYKWMRPWGPKTIPADATDEQIQAWKDYQTALKVEHRTADAAQTAYLKIAGSPYGDMRTFTFAPEDIANHPAVIAAKEQAAETLAPIQARIADLQAHIDAADVHISALDQTIQDTSSNIRDVWASARGNISLYSPEDARVPFSDTLAIPQDQGKGLWYAMKEDQFTEATPTQKMLDQSNGIETAPQSKARIADDLAARLENNDAFMALAQANKMTPSEQASDLVMEWGSKFKPGAPMPWAMQMAARDEFGLDVTIRGTAEQLRAAENLYTQNGEALRAFMRAQYDATQEFFASNGITEIELYRGFEWPLDTPVDQLPKGIDWGRPGNYDPAAALRGTDNESYFGKVGQVGTIEPLPGEGEFKLATNAISSYSADANISWAFTRDVWGDSQDQSYRLIIGGKVPVTRIMGTAQTGFGSKAEAEIVVLGANDDTVRYTAMIVNTNLADVVSEQQVTDALYVYKLSDGTEVSILSKPNGSFKITSPSIATASGSKTVKSEAGVNKVLAQLGIVKTYTAPATTAVVTDLGEMGALVAPAEETVVAEAAAAAGGALPAAVSYTLPEIDQQAEDQVIQAAKDALAGDGVASHTDAIAIGHQIDDYIDQRAGPLAEWHQEATSLRRMSETNDFSNLTGDQTAWIHGDTSAHGGLTIQEVETQYAAVRQAETVRLLEQVRDLGGVDIGIADGGDQSVADVLQSVQDLLPSDWLQLSTDQGDILAGSGAASREGLGYYAAQPNGRGRIGLKLTEGMTDEQKQYIAIHEIGHRFEDAVPGLWQMERDFYEARTVGEEYVKLTNGIQGLTKLDEWSNQYFGRKAIPISFPDPETGVLRRWESYELLSNGLQYVLSSDVRGYYYLQQDQEFWHFILGILFGAKGQPTP